MLNMAFKRRLSYGRRRNKFTGKELDAETGLYYYGARYLDPKTSRWLSGDPALGEYFPSAPVNDEAKKRNGNLPGQGGVFNYINLHAYHYSFNNPIRYIDPNGRSGEQENERLTAYEKDVILWKSEEFNTVNEAAIDFTKKYTATSVRMKTEIGATIYISENGKYYYKIPRIGTEISSVSYYGERIVANIHIHGAAVTGNEYLPSPQDINNVKQSQTISYVVTPLGQINRLDPDNNSPKGFSSHLLDWYKPNEANKNSGIYMISQSYWNSIIKK